MKDIKSRSRRFIYKTSLSWTGEKKGLLRSFGKPDIEVAAPPEFKGHQGKWTPEELFVASVNICIKTTFLYYAQRENFEFLSYRSEAEGVVERAEGRFIFSGIKIRPEISVKSDNQLQRAKELIELSGKNCLISNSIKSKVEVLPEIKVEQPL